MLQSIETINGYKCYIRMMDTGHLCGYVVIPKGHVLHGINIVHIELYEDIYDKCDIDVHGGLTYLEQEKDEYVVGFDCAHVGDIIPSNLNISMGNTYYGKWRTEEYVRKELDGLTKQLDKAKE